MIVILVTLIVTLDNAPNDLLFAFIFGLILWLISPLEYFLSKVEQQPRTISYWILRVGVTLGAMSYSVYLLHGKLQFLSSMFVRQILEVTNPLYGLMTILITLVICYPFYYFIERRFMSSNYTKDYKK